MEYTNDECFMRIAAASRKLNDKQQVPSFIQLSVV